MAKKLGKTARILKLARKYLKAGWTRGNLSASRDDVTCTPSKYGACYCISGALSRAEHEESFGCVASSPYTQDYATDKTHAFVFRHGLTQQARTALLHSSDWAASGGANKNDEDMHEVDYAPIVIWNDQKHRTKAQVLEALDRAYAAAKEMGV